MTTVLPDRSTYVFTRDVVKATGATSRQLDHWARTGYLRPINATAGSGRPRLWSAVDVRVAHVLVLVAKTGSSGNSELLFEAASDAVYRAGESELGQWLTIHFEGSAPWGVIGPKPQVSDSAPAWVCPLPVLAPGPQHRSDQRQGETQ
jgi:hypothetical protein